MSVAVADKRRKTRTVKHEPSEVFIHYQNRQGENHVVKARLCDVSEDGCGVTTSELLPVGSAVHMTGQLSASGLARELRVRAKVAWTRRDTDKEFRIGLFFEAPAEMQDPGGPPPATIDPRFEDYYEVLQVSPNADFDTIHRVYRILAQRYHPDHKETGNPEMFRRVLEAFRILSDPEKRANYDVGHRAVKVQRWKIFDQPEAALGVQAEKRKRAGVLAVLYTKRLQVPEAPWLSLLEMEELLGCPREHLEFTLWYLKEQGWVHRADNGRHIITVKGVDEAERSESLWLDPTRLLTDGKHQSAR